MLKIKQLSELTNTPASTIRYYEKEGLLVPSARSQGGYRLYNLDDVNKIRMIKFCQSVGFSLLELKPIFDETKPKEHEKILASLSAKQDELSELMRQLQNKQEQLIRLYRTLERSWANGDCLTESQIHDLLDSFKQTT